MKKNYRQKKVLELHETCRSVKNFFSTICEKTLKIFMRTLWFSPTRVSRYKFSLQQYLRGESVSFCKKTFSLSLVNNTYLPTKSYIAMSKPILGYWNYRAVRGINYVICYLMGRVGMILIKCLRAPFLCTSQSIKKNVFGRLIEMHK